MLYAVRTDKPESRNSDVNIFSHPACIYSILDFMTMNIKQPKRTNSYNMKLGSDFQDIMNLINFSTLGYNKINLFISKR